MSEPISIITLTIVGGLALIKISRLIIKFKNKKIISSCCSDISVSVGDDLHTSTHIHSQDTVELREQK